MKSVPVLLEDKLFFMGGECNGIYLSSKID